MVAKFDAPDQLYTIAYTSTVKRTDTLPAILAASNKNNPRDSISGVLWYEDETGRIIQILEGPKDKLDNLISRLQGDKRHWQMEIMYDRPISKRCYPAFGMLYGAEAAVADANEALKQALGKADQITEEASEKSERMRAEATDMSEMSRTGLLAAQQQTTSLQISLRQLNGQRDALQGKLHCTFPLKIYKRRRLEREVANIRVQIADKDEQLSKASTYQAEALGELAKQLEKQAKIDAAAAKLLADAEKAAKEVRQAAKRANEVALKEAKHKAEKKAQDLAKEANVGLAKVAETEEIGMDSVAMQIVPVNSNSAMLPSPPMIAAA